MSPDPPNPTKSLSDFLRKSQALPDQGLPLPPGKNESPLLRALLDMGTLPPAPQPPVIRDRWFKDQTLHIDGYVFERCRFDRCKLVTQIGTFVFRNSYIAPDCQAFFQGPSLKIVKFILHHVAMRGRISKLPGEQGIFPTINADGTFTLE